jgi:aspartate-semialdehyde dehydrogenase
MSSIRTLAVVGATGSVGRIVIEQLEKRRLPVEQYVFLASKRSAGTNLQFMGQTYQVRLLEPNAFQGIDLAIASTPDEVAVEFVPWARAAGTIVIDESAAHRMLPDVPLVIPEVNAHAIARHRGIIASPNCSCTQLVVALKPLHDAARVKRVVVTTYQATSGAGSAGSDELAYGLRASVNGSPFRPHTFQHPIANNLIPQIGSLKEHGYTSEELKLVYETRKILEDDSIQIGPTCVRVPVPNVHSESVVVQTEREVTPEEARTLFENFPGITVWDDVPKHYYPMPLNVDGRDDVVIGRIRKDLSDVNSLAFWCVSDNLRKGAATNAVQIAEALLRQTTSTCGT